jgi:zinc protease
MRSYRLQSLFAFLALLPATAFAAVTPPPPGPARDVKFPAFEQKTLANGLRVVVIEHHEQPAVSVQMLLNVGKVFEPAGKAGLAQATSALLTKGTAKRTSQQIAEAIDFVGGNLGANAASETGRATVLVTSDQVDLGLDLLSDVVLSPAFPQDEIDRWRSQSLSGLQVQQEDAGYLADSALARTIFGEHPFGRPADGTAESLQGLTREDFVAFHKRHYIPNDSILAVVGDVKPAEAFAKVEKYFGAWKKGEELKLPTAEIPKRTKHEIIVIDKPDAVQTEIRIGQPGIAFRDPDHFKAEVYNSVVGASASARLYEEIRRKRGLSYGANSFFVEGRQPGWFQASTFTKTESSVEATELALEVLRGMQKAPVPADELSSAKTFITGAFPLEIETPAGIAAKVLEAMRYGYDQEFIETYNEKVSAVSAADVQKFAQTRIQPEATVIVLAGNASAFSEGLKKLGEVRVIPYREVDLLRADLRKVKEQKPAAAAAPASGADQAKAMEIVKKAQEALGGKAFLEQRTQIAKGTGKINAPGVPQPVVIQSIVARRVLPDKERTDLAVPMGTMIQAFDGTTGWMSRGPQVQDQTEEMKTKQHYGLEVLRRAGKPGHTARALPDAEVNGKPVHVLEIADAEGHTTTFSIDKTTSLVSKVAFEDESGQSTEATYTDYRDVSGVKIAHTTNVSQNGQPLLEINYSEVQVNAPVDEAVFKKPGS